VQIVTQVLPVFHIGEQAQQLIVLAVVAGFPIAIMLAWLFDVTPEGIVRTEALPVIESPPRLRGDAAWTASSTTCWPCCCCSAWATSAPNAPFLKADRGSRPAASAADKSIAVLPFESLSDDKANAYFAEGIQDEILTRLSKLGALKVISRTSTQHYASSPDNLPEIARQLGVANILEGSVQKAGDTVHINVQLIRADGDEHLWAESYDRPISNIFSVENEVASAIADALNAKLSARIATRWLRSRPPARKPMTPTCAAR